MTVRSAAAAGVLLLATSFLAIPAQAGGTSSTESTRAQARALFLKGKQLGKENRWQDAYDALRQSFQIRPSHDTAADLAYAATKLGKFAEAARRASYALAHMPTGDPASKRKAVQKIFEEAAKHVATVKISADPAEATIAVDGKSVGVASALDGPLFLAPGTHTIDARAKGYQTQTTNLDAKDGAEQTVTLHLQVAPSAAPASTAMPGSGLATGAHDPQTQPPADTGTKQPPATTARPLWPALLGGGVAIAGLGAGIGFELAGQAKNRDVETLRGSLPAGNVCGSRTAYASTCAQLSDASDSLARDRNAALVGFVAAGVGAAFSAGYLVWRSASSGSGRAGTTPTAQVQPQLALGRRRALLGLRGSF